MARDLLRGPMGGPAFSLLVLAALLLATSASATPLPPPTGDWIIETSENVVLDGRDLVLPGALYVYGALTLNNSTVRFTPSEAYDAPFWVEGSVSATDTVVASTNDRWVYLITLGTSDNTFTRCQFENVFAWLWEQSHNSMDTCTFISGPYVYIAFDSTNSFVDTEFLDIIVKMDGGVNTATNCLFARSGLTGSNSVNTLDRCTVQGEFAFNSPSRNHVLDSTLAISLGAVDDTVLVLDGLLPGTYGAPGSPFTVAEASNNSFRVQLENVDITQFSASAEGRAELTVTGSSLGLLHCRSDSRTTVNSSTVNGLYADNICSQYPVNVAVDGFRDGVLQTVEVTSDRNFRISLNDTAILVSNWEFHDGGPDPRIGSHSTITNSLVHKAYCYGRSRLDAVDSTLAVIAGHHYMTVDDAAVITAERCQVTEVDLQGIANQVILRDSDLLGTLWIGGGYSGQGDEQLSYSPHLVLEESSLLAPSSTAVYVHPDVDQATISGTAAVESSWRVSYWAPDSTIVRSYPVLVRSVQGEGLAGAPVEAADSEGGVLWSGSTDGDGYAYPELTFDHTNYESEYRVSSPDCGMAVLTFLSSTPIILEHVPPVKVMFPACSPGRPYGPGLFVADADFSNPVRLTLPRPDIHGSAVESGCNWGTWSPDGTRVALTESEALAVLDLTALMRFPGQEPTLLVDEFAQQIMGWNATWSPDSQRLAFHTWPEGVYVVNVDGTNRRLLAPWPAPPHGIRHTRWSPDGARIVFRQGLDQTREGHLWVIEDIDDPAGPTVWQLTDDPSYTEIWPFWSPDGAKVAFTRGPAGWEWGEPSAELWVKDLGTGVETQLTDTPEICEIVAGWCPYDGHIYCVYSEPDDSTTIARVLPDGGGWEVVATLTDLWPGNELCWIPTGVWIDGLNALPGESVTATMGIADAESLAGVQAQVRYTGCCDILSIDSILPAPSILDWAMPDPAIGVDVASFLAYAPDPSVQSISDASHLFEITGANSPAAQPGDTQLLSFDDLLLSDDWGEPIERIGLAGGVRTIPFAYLEVSHITGPVCADSEFPVPFPVTIVARDRNGDVMFGCDTPLELHGFSGWDEEWPWALLPVTTPTPIVLVDGVWSGEATLAERDPNVQLLARWEDIGGYSNAFRAIGRGDVNADGRVSVLDVVKIANMAIDRGAWDERERWAADVNRDGEIDIFDVILAADRALEDMGDAAALAGAKPVRPTDPVAVTTSAERSNGQVILAVELSECAGLAGIQVEIEYGARRLSYAGMSAGDLLSDASTWTALDNDLGGTLKAIAYTPSRETLAGGEGTVLTFAFDSIGRGRGKVDLISVKLSDAEGAEIASDITTGKGKGKSKKP